MRYCAFIVNDTRGHRQKNRIDRRKDVEFSTFGTKVEKKSQPASRPEPMFVKILSDPGHREEEVLKLGQLDLFLRPGTQNPVQIC